MIEVFKTNVEAEHQSLQLVQELRYHYPTGSISFDLDDCDKILRIAADNLNSHHVIEVLQRNGFAAEVLL